MFCPAAALERLSCGDARLPKLGVSNDVSALAAVRARSGQTLLLLGASGNVGRYVAQLAALAEINVIGSASARSIARVHAQVTMPILGGVGLEQRLRDATTLNIDAVIDAAGVEVELDAAIALVGDRSRIATLVNFERAKRDRFQGLGGEEGQDEAGRMIRSNARFAIAALAEVGALDVMVDAVLPLSRAAEAHDRLLSGGAGKIVLVPQTRL